MANFVTPEIKQLYVNIINDLRSDIGRSVIVVSESTTIDCPNCGWDPVRKVSNNRYEPTDPYPTSTLVNAGVATIGPVDFPADGMRRCPVCNGVGKIATDDGTSEVNCLINPLSPQAAERTPLGKNYKINYELQAAISYQGIFETAKNVIIDGTVCVVESVIPTGIGDLTQINVYAGGGV